MRRPTSAGRRTAADDVRDALDALTVDDLDRRVVLTQGPTRAALDLAVGLIRSSGLSGDDLRSLVPLAATAAERLTAAATAVAPPPSGRHASVVPVPSESAVRSGGSKAG